MHASEAGSDAAAAASREAWREGFDLPRLQRQLRPLDLRAEPCPGDAEQAYFRFYGLDFAQRIHGLRHCFGHFGSGRYEVVAHYFEPPRPRGTCFVLHGYFDHSGLFRHVIEYCLARGLAVVAYDLPGHGLSTGERGHIHDFGEYRQVLEDALRFFAEQAPRPWTAIAQSTGAAVLMDYLLDVDTGADAPQLQQCVLLAPLVRIEGWSWVRLAYPVLRPLIRRVSRRFAVNSGDAEFLHFLEKVDPLQNRHIPLDWIGAMLRWQRRFHTLPARDLPLLVVQGQRDLTVAWQHNLQAIRQHFPQLRTLQLATGHHHMANETRALREKAFAAIDLYWSFTESSRHVP